MINYDLFRDYVIRCNLSLTDLSNGTGIPEFDLLKKCIGMDDFTVSEVNDLCNLLKLSRDDALKIFFPKYVPAFL